MKIQLKLDEDQPLLEMTDERLEGYDSIVLRLGNGGHREGDTGWNQCSKCLYDCDAVYGKKPLKTTYTSFCGVECCKGHESEVEPVWHGTLSMSVKPDTERITGLQAEVWVLKVRQNVTALALILEAVLIVCIILWK